MFKRVFRASVFVLLACAGSALAQQVYVEADHVSTVTSPQVYRYSGRIMAKASVDIVVRVEGDLDKVCFQEGDIVQAGQLLYEIRDTMYRADLENVQAQIEQLKARLGYTELRLKRAQELWKTRADTKEAFDSAQSEYYAAQGGLKAAQAQERIAQTRLEYTRIHAPITGKIGRTARTQGNYLASVGEVLTTIVQVDPIRASFSMANRDFLEVFHTAGDLIPQVKVKLQLADDSIYEQEGTLEFMDNRADLNTDAITVYASFPNPDGRLVPGTVATVLVELAAGTPRTAVLPSAVMVDGDGSFVWVLDSNNVPTRRDIQTGPWTDGMIEIVSGLTPGEAVVTDGTHKIVPDTAVVPVWRNDAGGNS